jgi:FkbH-like protein
MKSSTSHQVCDTRNRRVLLVGDTTLDPLARLLERGLEAPTLHSSVAPYSQVYQILLDPSHPAWAFQPDHLVVWTAPHLTLPSLGRLMRFELASHDEVLREAEQFGEGVLRAANRVGLVLVPTWIAPSYARWIQTLTWRQGIGLANLLAKANLVLAEKFAAQSNIVLLDAAYWQASLARPSHDPRMYAVAKILYSQQLFEKAASEIKAVLRGSLGLTRKVVVCDLDNTLWGGVAAEDGPEAIKLGAPDPVGECFRDFQESLQALRTRGILLAICSKNDEDFALSVIEHHPDMALRKDDFVAWRINWREKAENLVALSEELNLGLESFVFLDDSPQERDQVRQMLPQVLAPNLPLSPSDLAPFVSSMTCFEAATLAHEDFERTDMYRAERGRREALEAGGDVEDWLRSLQIEVRCAPLQRESLPRAAQLLNKTNQFNLSLRRMDEKSFWDWAAEPGNSAYVFHVSDRFGDFGLTGLASLVHLGTEARIVDFVMSCRVMGKKVEELLLWHILGKARAEGAARVTAPPVEGPRNAPAREFFAAKYSSSDAGDIDPARVVAPPFIRLKEERWSPHTSTQAPPWKI